MLRRPASQSGEFIYERARDDLFIMVSVYSNAEGMITPDDELVPHVVNLRGNAVAKPVRPVHASIE